MGKKNKLSKSSLHWFIRSRPYVLLAELRRRFDLDGTEEVRAIQTPEGKTYVGLPDRAARLLEELVREHRIGLDYVVDLHARLAIGVFAYDLLKTPLGPHPMRPGAPRVNGAAGAQHDEDAEEAPEDDEVATVAAPEPPPRPARPRTWAPRAGVRGGPRPYPARSDEPRASPGRPDEARPAAGRPGGRRPEPPRREERPERAPGPEQTRSVPAGQEPRRRRRGGKRGSDRPETRSGRQP